MGVGLSLGYHVICSYIRDMLVCVAGVRGCSRNKKKTNKERVV